MQAIVSAASQAWPPFVLVAGLLLIGAVAAADGLFEATGARLARTRLGARGLLLALLGLVAVVTAVLNLDTAVVFLTPVLVDAARHHHPRRPRPPLARARPTAPRQHRLGRGRHRRNRRGPDEQPARGGLTFRQAAHPPRRTPARAQPRPQPRRHRIALRRPLAPS